MNRRKFVSTSTISLFASLVYPNFTLFSQQQPIKVKGNFGIKIRGGFTNPEVTIDAKDVLIDGLTIPKFTWSWIGLGIAEGILNVVGGAIINAIFNAIGGGKSMEQLLREQLESFARIVEDAIDNNALREYKAHVSAFMALFQEYSNDRTKGRIDFLINESAVKLSEIESLGFKGYRTYMTCAGLRLSLLQEVYRKKRTAGTKKNFDLQVARSIDHHKAMIKFIEEQTDPVIVYQENYNQMKKLDIAGMLTNKSIDIKEKRLGETIEGKIPVQNSKIMTIDEIARWKRQIAEINKTMLLGKIKDDYIDFYAIRKKLKSENTDLGEKMITRWQGKI